MFPYGLKARWNLRRTIFLFLAGAAFVATEIGRFKLRPAFRASGFDDHGLTDSIGNSGGILVQIFLCLAIINPPHRLSYLFAAFFSAGFILYEFVQPWLPKGVFDWNDVGGTLVGFAISLPVIFLVWRVAPDGNR